MSDIVIEKKAVSREDRQKYIKYAITSAVAAAGIGSFIRDIKSKKDRAKALDAEKSSDSIVVPMSIRNFMKDLPTPAEQAEEVGATKAIAGNPEVARLSADDIAAKKKEILGGHRFDFFSGRKAAEVKPNDEDAEAEKNDDKKADDSKSEGNGGSNSDGKGRVVLRDQSGKFMSPTCPVAVAQVEKCAAYDWSKLLEFFSSPVESSKVVWDSMLDHPVAWTAGGLTSLWLAEKLSDVINSYRKDRSKNNLNAAREEYVKLLQNEDDGDPGSVKAAESNDDPRVTIGKVLGGAFIIPATLTALVAHRVMENRKAEKKRQGEMADSYPRDPTVLYRTIDDLDQEKVAEDSVYPTIIYKAASGKEIEMTPASALALIALQRDMMMAAERESDGIFKSAGFLGDAWDATKDFGKYIFTGELGKDIANAQNAKKQIEDFKKNPRAAIGEIVGKHAPFSAEQAENYFMGLMNNPNNNDRAYSALENLGMFENGVYDEEKARKAIEEMVKADPNTMAQLQFQNFAKNKKNLDELRNRLRTSRGMQDYMADRMSNSKYDNTFGKVREQKVNDWLGRAFDHNGIMYQIMSWIMNNMGLGRYFARNQVNNQFDQWRNAAANTQQPAGNVATTPATPATPAAPTKPNAAPAAPTASTTPQTPQPPQPAPKVEPPKPPATPAA